MAHLRDIPLDGVPRAWIMAAFSVAMILMWYRLERGLTLAHSANSTAAIAIEIATQKN